MQHQPYFELEIEHLIDLDGDHRKEELLLRSYEDDPDSGEVQMRLHAIKLSDEHTFMKVDSILVLPRATDEIKMLNTVWDPKQNQLLIQHQFTEIDSPSIDVYVLENGKFIKNATFTKNHM